VAALLLVAATALVGFGAIRSLPGRRVVAGTPEAVRPT
jgi:hypothetical protein